MDFHAMKRNELQALSKKHKIAANLTNREMAHLLALRFKVGCGRVEDKLSKQGRSCLKNLEEVVVSSFDDKIVNKESKKVTFSPQDETFEFEMTDPQAVRLAGRRRMKSALVDKGKQTSDFENSGKSSRARGRKSTQNVAEKQNFASESGNEQPVFGEIREITVQTRKAHGKKMVNTDVSEKSKLGIEVLPVEKRQSRRRKAMHENLDKENDGVPDCVHEAVATPRRYTRRANKVIDNASSSGHLPAPNAHSACQDIENVDSEDGETGARVEHEAQESTEAVTCQPEASKMSR